MKYDRRLFRAAAFAAALALAMAGGGMGGSGAAGDSGITGVWQVSTPQGTAHGGEDHRRIGVDLFRIEIGLHMDEGLPEIALPLVNMGQAQGRLAASGIDL